MSGTKAGGIAARDQNRSKYGKDYYARIGSIGGKNSVGGGFASLKRGLDGLTGPERASAVGVLGGRKSRRK